jgi:hypothetical protein
VIQEVANADGAMSKRKPSDGKDAAVWRRIKPVEDFAGEAPESTGEITDVQGPPTLEDVPQVPQVIETSPKSRFRAFLSQWLSGFSSDRMSIDEAPRTLTAEMEAATLSARKRRWRWVVYALALAALGVLSSPFWYGAKN